MSVEMDYNVELMSRAFDNAGFIAGQYGIRDIESFLKLVMRVKYMLQTGNMAPEDIVE